MKTSASDSAITMAVKKTKIKYNKLQALQGRDKQYPLPIPSKHESAEVKNNVRFMAEPPGRLFLLFYA
jgi:hypothetical protein